METGAGRVSSLALLRQQEAALATAAAATALAIPSPPISPSGKGAGRRHSPPPAPSDYCCPITGLIMRDPVLAPDGHVYERASIMEWLQMNLTSPVTGEPLQEEAVLVLTPVHLLKKMIGQRHIQGTLWRLMQPACLSRCRKDSPCMRYPKTESIARMHSLCTSRRRFRSKCSSRRQQGSLGKPAAHY